MIVHSHAREKKEEKNGMRKDVWRKRFTRNS
jgi:hypothetical protein